MHIRTSRIHCRRVLICIPSHTHTYTKKDFVTLFSYQYAFLLDWNTQIRTSRYGYGMLFDNHKTKKSPSNVSHWGKKCTLYILISSYSFWNDNQSVSTDIRAVIHVRASHRSIQFIFFFGNQIVMVTIKACTQAHKFSHTHTHVYYRCQCRIFLLYPQKSCTSHSLW